jgi:hypothetical protein
MRMARRGQEVGSTDGSSFQGQAWDNTPLHLLIRNFARAESRFDQRCLRSISIANWSNLFIEVNRSLFASLSPRS